MFEADVCLPTHRIIQYVYILNVEEEEEGGSMVLVAILV